MVNLGVFYIALMMSASSFCKLLSLRLELCVLIICDYRHFAFVAVELQTKTPAVGKSKIKRVFPLLVGKRFLSIVRVSLFTLPPGMSNTETAGHEGRGDLWVVDHGKM